MKRLLSLALAALVVATLLAGATVGAAPKQADRGAWAPGVAYAVGDTVTYNGVVYKCLQAHTSQTGWEPPNVPALWQAIGTPTPGGGAATNTPTRTNTPAAATSTPTRTPTRTNTPAGATNTPTRTNTPAAATNTPTRTNTPAVATNTPTRTPTSSGAACWPAWDANTAYNGGAQVSYNGVNYQAAYWTQGQRPDLYSGPAGSGQPWIPMGACGGGAATNTPTRTNTPSGATATPTRTPTSVPSGGVNYNAAPYVMPRDNNPPDITAVINATGVKTFTLAFILAYNGTCSPAWDGVDPISTDTVVAAYINKIRAAGGDIVVSIGGYGGTKLGQVCSGGEATYNAYKQVVDKYNLKAIDFDIEEPEIENAAAVANELYAAKKFVDAGLNVSITLPVTTSGLNWFGYSENNPDSVLVKARTLGLVPTTWNVMPFDGGFPAPMGTTTCNVLETVHNQLKAAFGWDDATAYAHQGVSLMNGRSDTGEYTYVSDFNTIKSCVKSKGMKRMTFWSVNRDRSCVPIYGVVDPGTKGDCSSVTQNDWDFTKVFNGF